MGYLCSKSLTLGNVEYHPGDIIPDGAVLESRVRQLTKSGYIKDISQEEEYKPECAEAVLSADGPEGCIQIPIFFDCPEEDAEEVQSLPMTEGDIQLAASIMQMKADAAEKAIEEVQSDTVLIFLDACDSRNTVKKAAKKQASKLSSTQDKNNEARTCNEPTEE